MLAIAGGIILAFIALSLLPLVFMATAKAFQYLFIPAVVLAVAALLYYNPSLAYFFWVIPPAILFLYVAHWGGIRNFIKYLSIAVRRTPTAQDIADKELTLRAFRKQVDEQQRANAEERRKQIVEAASNRLISAMTKKVARLCPGAPILIVPKNGSYSVIVGQVEAGIVQIHSDDELSTNNGQEMIKGSAKQIASTLDRQLRQYIKEHPEVVSKLVA